METLETKRLSLERWDERHRERWRLICRDPEVMRFIGSGRLWETAKADEVFDGMLAHWRDHGFGWRSVLDTASGEWLGFVGPNMVGPGVQGVAPEEVEIGWWLLRLAWGRGYASEAASAARDEGVRASGPRSDDRSPSAREPRLGPRGGEDRDEPGTRGNGAARRDAAHLLPRACRLGASVKQQGVAAH